MLFTYNIDLGQNIYLYCNLESENINASQNINAIKIVLMKFLITNLFTTCLFLFNHKYLSWPRTHKDIVFVIKKGRKASLT